MATKLNLLKDFQNGQGVSGGLPNYSNYPQDHDTNYTSIEQTVNQLVDEVAAARLADALIPADLITHRNIDTNLGGARFRHDDFQVTRPNTTTVDISEGVAYIQNKRISTSGASVDFTGLPTTNTYYIPIDASGLVLSPTTTADSSFFDIVTVLWDGSLTDADVTDNLFNEGQVLLISDQGFIQGLHSPGDEIQDPFNVNYAHRLNPPVRSLQPDGTLGESGFFSDNYLSSNIERWFWVSENEAGGDTVLSGILTGTGQLLLLNQARVMLTRTGVAQAIPTASLTAIEWDTLPTTNTAGVAERFEPDNYVASTDWQSGTGNVNIVIPNNAAYNGTYMFTGIINMNMDDSVATYLDVRITQTVGGSAIVTRDRLRPAGTSPTLFTFCGMYDFEAGDTFQVQIEHNHGADRDLDFARFTMMLLGGGA